MNYKKLQIIAASFMMALTITACSESQTKISDVKETPINVTVANLTSNANLKDLAVTGQVQSAHTANVSTRLMGYITKIFVKAGDQVKAGQLLFTVNSSDIQAKQAQVDAMLKQAEAGLQVAQKDFDRYTILHKQNSASTKELEQVNLQYQSAKANVDAAKAMQREVQAQLNYANVVAPFTGVVTQKLVDEGSMANPGMPIVTLEQGGALQIRAVVPENEISRIKVGNKANISVDAANKTFASTLIEISPSSQFTGGQYIIKLSIPSSVAKALLSGMYAQVTIQTNELGSKAKLDSTISVMIPKTALVYRDQLVGVYTVSAQNTALLRWLRTGKELGGNVEILSGLSKSEPYILSAEGNLYNGAKLNIK
jgi:RND family efflux transporter MFP subunit